MTDSYSASLLEAWNPNLSAYSTSIPEGQNQTCTASLNIGDPIYGQPLDGEVECELGGFGKLYRGEFHDEICQHLSFDLYS